MQTPNPDIGLAAAEQIAKLSPVMLMPSKTNRRLLAACLAASLAGSVLSAADEVFLRNWPAWRGPLFNGVGWIAIPPVEWSETKNVKWKIKVPGQGTSTPIVWEDKVFILTAVPTGRKPDAAAAPTKPEGPMAGMVEGSAEIHQFLVLCYDRATGKELWRRVAREEVPHEAHHRDHGYASASPVTDGECLVTHFGSRGTHCYDLNGKLLWEKDLGKMQTRNSFGEGSSPALSGNVVVILWDHEGDDFIVAFDKRDGRELWRQKRDEPTGWTTPLIVEHGGRKQVVVNATNKVRCYDLETGALLWECAGQTANAIPSAVPGEGVVYLTSGFRGSALQAIKLGRAGDLAGTDAIVWSYNRNTPYVPTPLLYGSALYVFSGNNALLTVFDARTGERFIDGQRLEGMNGVYASPVGAAGRVYLTGRDGNVWVIKRDRRFEVLAKNKLQDGFDASPALVGNEIFLRGRENLYCISAAGN